MAGKVSMREAVYAAVVDSETKQFEITIKTSNIRLIQQFGPPEVIALFFQSPQWN